MEDGIKISGDFTGQVKMDVSIGSDQSRVILLYTIHNVIR
jgi:hypothetical protein